MKKILVCTHNEIAFKQYATDLHEESIKLLKNTSELCSLPLSHLKILDPLFFESLQNTSTTRSLALKIQEIAPDLIHFHHEYGFLGSKKPFQYQFPRLVKLIKKNLPSAKISATAHTVISEDFNYPLRGRGTQLPFRWIANTFLKPCLLELWNQKSWHPLDGVSVHSKDQVETILKTHGPKVTFIPHYIPLKNPPMVQAPPSLSLKLHQALQSTRKPIVFVFGFFTPEKGQDIAIEAFRHLKTDAHLILAGGVRRKEDHSYFEECQKKIKKYALEDKITTTGFIEFHDLDILSEQAALALVPFRSTSGSGSLANLFARAIPTLASQLPLNIEIDERMPGCLNFFESENPKDCAFMIDHSLANPEVLKKQREKISKYAEKYSAHNMAAEYLQFFNSLL